MKYLKTTALVVGLICSVACSQAQLAFPGLTYGQNSGGQINFGSSGFTFSGPLGDSFKIAASTGVGDSIGDLGSITGTFTIGTIVGNSASVGSSGGTLTIYGAGGATLTGALTWVNIAQVGAITGFNSMATANLTGITFSGAPADNSDLMALAAPGNAIDTLSFVFAGSLASLKAGGVTEKGFSGNLWNSAVPEPTTIIAGSLLLLPFGLSTIRIIRNRKSAV